MQGAVFIRAVLQQT